MIEIDDPPDIRACAAHSVPLVWHFSARAGVWKAWEPVEEDPELMRRHRCEHHGDPAPRRIEIRDAPDPAIAARAHAGAAYARAELEKRQRDGGTS